MYARVSPVTLERTSDCDMNVRECVICGTYESSIPYFRKIFLFFSDPVTEGGSKSNKFSHRPARHPQGRIPKVLCYQITNVLLSRFKDIEVIQR